jgi:hypothetical protein
METVEAISSLHNAHRPRADSLGQTSGSAGGLVKFDCSGSILPLPANAGLWPKTPPPPFGMEERAGERRRVGFQEAPLSGSLPARASRGESELATTFGNGGCENRRSQGHAALSRQTLVKPPALPEVADTD